MSASSYEAPSSVRAAGASAPGASDSLAAARRVLADLVVSGDHAAHILYALEVLGAPWLQRHGLAPLAYVRYQTLADLLDELRAELKRAYYAALADTALLHQSELVAVLKALSDCDIVAVPFKGAALAFTVYPNPACRPMGDLDLWVTAAEMDAAQRALERIGYQYVSNPDRSPALLDRFIGERQMVGTRFGTGWVELHWRVFVGEWLRRTALVDENAVRQRLCPTDRLGLPPITLLAPEDAVLQLLVHTAVNHQFSMSVLRSLIDVTLLARSAPLDWTAVAERARIWRIATVTWLGLSLAIDLVGLSEARAILPRLAPSRLRQACLARLVNADRIVTLTDVSASRSRFILLLLMVDRKRDMLKLVFRTLWPERKWLIARYGHYTFSTRLHHFFNAARGRI